MRANALRNWIVVTLLGFGAIPGSPSAWAQLNSWTNSSSDSWATAGNWSLGVPPSTNVGNGTIFITNSLAKFTTTKTVAYFDPLPASASVIFSLTISAPAGLTNMLQVHDSSNTLHILNGLTLTSGGALTVSNATLQTDGLSGPSGILVIDGDLSNRRGGVIVATNWPTYVGYTGTGSVTVTGGTLLPVGMEVGHAAGSQGTLTVGPGSTSFGFAGFTIGHDLGSSGMLWVRGGTLAATNGSGIGIVGLNGVGQMTVSNGTVLVRFLDIGNSFGGQGTLTVAGGICNIYDGISLGASDCTATGTIVVGGGSLFVTNATHTAVLEVHSGTLELSSGLLQADTIVMTNACSHFVRTGGTLIYSSAVLNAARDDDGDGLPNGWEQTNGVDALDPFGNNGAAGDPDGDGQTNLQEFQAGTSPTNAASAFQATSLTRETNSLRIQWLTGVGKTNALQAANGNFTNFVTIFTVTNTVGGTTNYLDVGGATNVPARFYRVRLVP